MFPQKRKYVYNYLLNWQGPVDKSSIITSDLTFPG